MLTSDKIDELIANNEYLDRLSGTGDHAATEALKELKRLRAMETRLEEWAVELESEPFLDDDSMTLRRVATEIRNRMGGV